MKSISSFVGAVAAVFVATTASAFATVCGQLGAAPCDVPEPGSLGLVALAIAGVVLVARRKK